MQQPVGRHVERYVGAFDGDADVREVILLQQRDMAQRALHERLRRHAAVLCQQLLLQRAAVHADADGHLVRAAAVHDRLHTVLPADVAGVDADLVRAVLRRGDGKAVVKVNVRHERNMNAVLDGLDRLRCLRRRHGHAHDLAARLLQAQDLLDGRACVLGLCVAHRLDGDRRAAADGHAADHDLLRHASSLLTAASSHRGT